MIIVVALAVREHSQNDIATSRYIGAVELFADIVC